MKRLRDQHVPVHTLSEHEEDDDSIGHHSDDLDCIGPGRRVGR
jgi:hypothetical protein